MVSSALPSPLREECTEVKLYVVCMACLCVVCLVWHVLCGVVGGVGCGASVKSLCLYVAR